MSRWWPKSVRATLAPDDAGAGRASWSGPLAALVATLGVEPKNVTLTLSDRLVRYFALPSSPALAAESDWRLFAARRLETVFGADAAAHAILLSKKSPAGRVACAVERALIDAIYAALHGAGHQLVSLRPRFATAFDRARRSIGNGDAWFVSQEPGSLTIGLAAGGEWHLVRQRRVGAQWLEELPGFLERESQLAGLSARVPSAYVAVLQDSGPLPASAGGFAIQRVAS